MGKRKKSAPKKFGAAERQDLTWNMLDTEPGTSDLPNEVIVIPSDDSSLELEAEDAERENDKGSTPAKQRKTNKTSIISKNGDADARFSTMRSASAPSLILDPGYRTDGTSGPNYRRDDLVDMFDRHASNCLFSFQVLTNARIKTDGWICVLGTFNITFSPAPLFLPLPISGLPNREQFTLHVSNDGEKNIFSYDASVVSNLLPGSKKSLKRRFSSNSSLRSSLAADRDIRFWLVDTSLPASCLEAFKCKAIQVILDTFDADTMCMKMKIVGNDDILAHLSHPGEAVRPKMLNESLKVLMDHFHGISSPSAGYSHQPYIKKHNIDELFRMIKDRHGCLPPTIIPSVQHPDLLPRLRPYQKQAISWMVQREMKKQENNSDEVHMLYTEVKTLDGKTLYFNKYAGTLVIDWPLCSVTPPGGILGDEMGLGKTVEVLACMLHHPRPSVAAPAMMPIIEDDEIEPVTETKKKKKSKPRRRSRVRQISGTDSDDTVNYSAEPPSVPGPIILTSITHPSEVQTNNASRSSDTGKDEVNCMTDKLDIESNNISKNDIQGLEVKDEEHGCLTDKLDNRSNNIGKNNTESLEAKNDKNDGINIVLKEIETVIDVNVVNGGEQLRVQVDKHENVQDKHENMQTEHENVLEITQDKHENIQDEHENIQDKHENIQDKHENMQDKHENIQDEHENMQDKHEHMQDKHENMQDKHENVQDKHENIQDKHENMQGKHENVLNTHENMQDKRENVQDKAKTEEMISSTDNKCIDEVNVSDPAMECMTKMNSSQIKPKVLNTTAGYKNIFSERPEVHRAEFECLCGSRDLVVWKARKRKRLHAVQCTVCRLWQHAECVNYDVKNPYRGEFKCPHCHAASVPIESGATLIISPAAIAHQWVEEILKHVAKQAINVLMYEGVNKQRYIQPRTLAKQDIVITTYETLRKEIDYVDLPHSNSREGRQFRHPKRFMAIPSPITAVQWWRICLDEAQMVECTTTKTAEMALRLSGVNRWCVTGTPIQKGVQDLYGLLLFLGVEPYLVQMWWAKLLYEPFCHGVTGPMYDLLSTVLWRTVKLDVLDQINIPDQTEEVHLLNFSPVEEHFYRRQYKDCVKLSMQTLRKWTDSTVKLCSLDRATVAQMLNPLVRLRQACCHPQVVRGEFLPLKKDMMTMDELLDSLIKKAKTEAEESHRLLVAAMNGQAGLHIILEQFPDAVEQYREVLRSIEEHKDSLKTDSLQKLHAMYNLSEILSSKPAGVDPTLRDDLLPKQIDELKEHYLAKAVAYLKSTEDALLPAQVDVKQAHRELDDGELWFLDVIEWAVSRQLDENMLWKLDEDVKKDKSHFDRNNRERPRTFLERHLNSTRSLQYAMHKVIGDMKVSYKTLQKAMSSLNDAKPSQDLINQTVECCLRPVDKVLNSCPFCKTRELFEDYESKLFSFVEKDVVRLGADGNMGYKVNREGTWADSDMEKALKSLLNFAKSYKVSENLIEYGTSHLKLFEALKKEYKKLRAHWAGKKEHVATFDELDMSTTRLRLRLPDEPVPEIPQLNILDKTELPQHKLKLSSERIIANAELRKKLGQLLYLSNLAKNQVNTEDGSNPDPCPICQQELGKNWSVMQCGHCYCMDCVRILQERASFGRQNFTIKCAICRQSSHQTEISYVVTTHKYTEEDVKVKGSHSTKVEAVVKCLLEIRKEDPTAKALVFSTWTDVLSVIARALTENNLNYKALYTAGKFQENLASFKQSAEETILLLPVHSGANGLNLIEATHVLLVEPILNPAQELQAIGRVHRIGQTRPTHVHRFLIQNTIEQKMITLLKSMDVGPSTLKASEEMSLTIGDISSLFVQQMEPLDREGNTSPAIEDSSEMENGSGDHGNNNANSIEADISMETGPSHRGLEADDSVRPEASNRGLVIDFPSDPSHLSIEADFSTEAGPSHHGLEENNLVSPVPSNRGLEVDFSSEVGQSNRGLEAEDSVRPGPSNRGLEADFSVEAGPSNRGSEIDFPSDPGHISQGMELDD